MFLAVEGDEQASQMVSTVIIKTSQPLLPFYGILNRDVRLWLRKRNRHPSRVFPHFGLFVSIAASCDRHR
jgi:hypothetical protein